MTTTDDTAPLYSEECDEPAPLDWPVPPQPREPEEWDADGWERVHLDSEIARDM